MILLLAFLSIFIGLSFRYNYLACSILIVAFIFYLYKRFNKRTLLFCTLLIGCAIGISYIHIHIDKSVFTGVVSESHDNYFIFNTGLEKLYVYSKNNPYEIGDILTISGYSEPTSFTVIESGFDFGDYLAKKGIYYQLYSNDVSIRFSNFIRIRAYQNYFLNGFDSQTRPVVASILFSRNEDSPIVDALSNWHLHRLISASGIYLMAFIHFFSMILSFKIKKKWSDLIAVFILLFYAIFTFPRFTVIKILIIYIAKWINDNLAKKKIDYISLISIIGILFLIIDFHLAYQDSYILGFMIPIFIYYVRPIFKSKHRIKNKIMVGLFIYLFLIPFELKFNNSISLLSIPITALLSPIFIVFSCCALLCFYGIPLQGVVNLLTNPLKFFTTPLQNSYLFINAPPLNEVLFVIYYFLLIVFLYYYSIGFVPIHKTICAFSLSLCFIYFVPINNVVTNSVSFINVGQGDACLIRSQNTTVLIDTGGSLYSDIATENLIPFFRKNRIYDIDLVITTHDDNDHCGALESLKSNFVVKNYIKSSDKFPINIGNIHLKNYNLHVEESKEDNDKSLVIGFSLSNVNYLIMGDAPISIEKKMMQENKYIPCDVLKIGHHGSDTSTCESFIRYLKPKDAIVSVGKNSYGHPNKKVLNMLKRNLVNIKRTDEMGTIIYSNYIFM